ncbi:MAG: hypothetical protein KAJ35_10345 [Thermoplasmata archaeon]|nr:hypothetical protein [Thermoplasmata archaeon]
MNLTDRVDRIVFWSTVFAIFMIGLAVVSIFEHYEYVTSGGEEGIFLGGLCIAIEFAILLLISAYAVPAAMQVAKRRRTPKSLRALYVFMLLPIVFIGVVVGMGSVTLLNVMLFGWPLFITAGSLVPWAAYTLQREAGFLHFLVRCGFCKIPFKMERTAKTRKCPYCLMENRNPYMPTDASAVEMDPRDEPLDPSVDSPFGYSDGMRMRELPATITAFLTPAALVGLLIGAILMFDAWDDSELLLGLGFFVAGLFGFCASAWLVHNRDPILTIAASFSLMVLGLGGVVVVNVFGLFVGLMAMPALVFSIQLMQANNRAKSRRVRFGTLVDENDPVG